MQGLSTVFKACLTGGIIAICAQALMMLFGSFGLDPLFILFFTILTAGVIGGLLWLPGIWDKIQEFGSFGAILPLCGLVPAIAGIYAGIRGSGKSAGQTYIAVWGIFFKLFGLGIVVCAAIGVAVALFIK